MKQLLLGGSLGEEAGAFLYALPLYQGAENQIKGEMLFGRFC